MRILILSQYYAPEPIPKPSDLARELARRGHDVHVLTGVPHYPTGRLRPGYRLRVRQTEQIDGIPVTRMYEYPYHGTHTIRRLLNYATFMVSAPIGALRLGRFDAIYVWHPPLSVGIAAWLVGRMTRAPFVYDVQDIWPDAAVLSGLLRPGRVIRAFRHVERNTIERLRVAIKEIQVLDAQHGSFIPPFLRRGSTRGPRGRARPARGCRGR